MACGAGEANHYARNSSEDQKISFDIKYPLKQNTVIKHEDNINEIMERLNVYISFMHNNF